MSDTNGSSLGTIKYLPFGLTRAGDVPTDKKFTGQRLDTTGLYYYGARYYDPIIGRFISPDTIVPNPMNPQSLNRYSYCSNNPLRYIDPSGHYDLDYWFSGLPWNGGSGVTLPGGGGISGGNTGGGNGSSSSEGNDGRKSLSKDGYWVYNGDIRAFCPNMDSVNMYLSKIDLDDSGLPIESKQRVEIEPASPAHIHFLIRPEAAGNTQRLAVDEVKYMTKYDWANVLDTTADVAEGLSAGTFNMPLELAAGGLSYIALTVGVGLTPLGALITISGAVFVAAIGPEFLRDLADQIER